MRHRHLDSNYIFSDFRFIAFFSFSFLVSILVFCTQLKLVKKKKNKNKNKNTKKNCLTVHDFSDQLYCCCCSCCALFVFLIESQLTIIVMLSDFSDHNGLFIRYLMPTIGSFEHFIIITLFIIVFCFSFINC